MKQLFLTALFSIVLHTAEAMSELEVLEQFETCHNTFIPAQQNDKEAFVWFSGLSHPLFNVVMHLSCDHDVAAKVDFLIQKAGPKTPISFWIHSQNRAKGLVEILQERQFASIGTFPLMAWKVAPKAAPFYEVRPATKPDFYPILAHVNELDEHFTEQFANLLDNSPAQSYLVYADTMPIPKPVGTGTMLQCGNVGAILNIATLPSYQRQGYGKSMMLFLMNQAKKLDLAYLVLLSSPAAEKLYSDLGFQKILDIEIYMGT